MARGRRSSLVIRLTEDERAELERVLRSTKVRAGLARRARVVLLRAEGKSISHVARQVDLSRRLVYKWIGRYLKKGLRGLGDKPGRGRKPVFPPRGRGASRQARLRKAG